MLGILGNSVASQGGVDAILHGLVAFGRSLLGKAPQLCVAARFDTTLDASLVFSTTVVAAPLYMTTLGASPLFSTETGVMGEFSSMIQVDLTWLECE